jgi:hypothetical protein
MCDELDDVFADEPKWPAKALEYWNRTFRPAWAPFLKWEQLSVEDRSICWNLYDTNPSLR